MYVDKPSSVGLDGRDKIFAHQLPGGCFWHRQPTLGIFIPFTPPRKSAFYFIIAPLKNY
jgi:hypothetical protein